VLTLVVVLVVAAIVAGLVMAFGGLGPRVIRRTTVVDRPVPRPARRTTVIEEDPVDRVV
jgi:hypothetical protein